MGIRFRCPQGHPLNVKAELAGKRGVCPQCGAKVQIPWPSTVPSPKGERSEEGSTATAAVTKEQSPPAESLAQAEVASSLSSSPAVVGEGIESISKPQADLQSAEVIAHPQAGVEDVWYVRPPEGGQFGPASSADFAHWIREGRVTPEAYVWRAGWADWRKAGEVADLPAPIPVAAVPVALERVAPALAPMPTIVQLDKSAAAPRPSVRKHRSANRQLTVAALLLIVAVVLAGVLIWVLNRKLPETSRSATEPWEVSPTPMKMSPQGQRPCPQFLVKFT